ncbi:glycosyltransferase family A protein [uncultured Psychroserpens sp.]|uniref:glycosyltransferase family 2 protein n=1 Tax=uncultured Psychroserpens sp. TaxID=255436 RepID=UPI002639CCDD|nr:glycosyltransferase family A protein [uncultured Psychroserpens sp.]
MSLQDNKPEVSVIMPVYNGEAYIVEAIHSVLNQSFTDFEFIIINDGSTDHTQTLIERFSDARIKSFYHENQGVARSLNTALKYAVGKYIWRHDADDICLPEQLQTQIQFLKSHTDFALVSTQIAFMTNRGKIAYNYKQPKDVFFENAPFIKVVRAHFNPYSPITHATVLIKKEVFETVGYYRTEFKTSEDTDLWLRILEHYNAAVMHYCSYFVRINSSSATQVHKKTNTFYRDLAYKFADERNTKGTDSLQRGEIMPEPIENELEVQNDPNFGKHYRNDLLDFRYRLVLDAKDYINAFKIMRLSIKDGWRLSRVWKAIFLPLLGDKIVDKGIKAKKAMKL